MIVLEVFDFGVLWGWTPMESQQHGLPGQSLEGWGWEGVGQQSSQGQAQVPSSWPCSLTQPVSTFVSRRTQLCFQVSGESELWLMCSCLRAHSNLTPSFPFPTTGRHPEAKRLKLLLGKLTWWPASCRGLVVTRPDMPEPTITTCLDSVEVPSPSWVMMTTDSYSGSQKHLTR